MAHGKICSSQIPGILSKNEGVCRKTTIERQETRDEMEMGSIGRGEENKRVQNEREFYLVVTAPPVIYNMA